MDVMWINQHPDYIKEKWNRFIGVTPNKLELYPQDDKTVTWLKKWDIYHLDTVILYERIN